MFNRSFLHTMYQQWSHGAGTSTADLMRFVTMAAHQHRVTVEAMLEELKNCYWFPLGK